MSNDVLQTNAEQQAGLKISENLNLAEFIEDVLSDQI